MKTLKKYEAPLYEIIYLENGDAVLSNSNEPPTFGAGEGGTNDYGFYPGL